MEATTAVSREMFTITIAAAHSQLITCSHLAQHQQLGCGPISQPHHGAHRRDQGKGAGDQPAARSVAQLPGSMDPTATR
jgi:hypothetical protein